MSFLTICTLISISVPGITQIVQSVLLNFIYLDILQTDKWLIPLIYGKSQSIGEEDMPLNSFFDENGFNSRSLIKNLGSTFIYLVVLVLGVLFTSLI
jgi:hypothetical protein